MSKIIKLFMILLSGFLSSCGDYINMNYPDYEKKLFVESYITENDTSIVVILQKTVNPFEEYIDIVNDSSLRADGAIVNLSDGNNTVQFDQMQTRGTIYEVGKGTAYYKKVRIEEQKEYYLNINYKGQQLSAVTSFPQKTRISEPAIKYQYSKGNHLFTLHAKLLSSETKIKHYRLHILFDIYLNNKNYLLSTANKYFDIMDPEATTDITITQKNTFVSYSGESLQSPRRAIVVLERLSDFYYNFREAVEIQKDDNDTFWGSEITEIPTNIKNGYGIFTGITKDTVCVNISQ